MAEVKAPELPYEIIEKAATRDQIRKQASADGGKMGGETYFIPLKKIKVRPGYNVRTDMGDIEGLAKDIAQNGLVMPMTLDLVFPKKGKPYWVVEIGHRRFSALQWLVEKGLFSTIHGKKGISDGAVECFVNRVGVTEYDRLVRLYSSNHHKEFTPLENAEQVRRLEVYYEKTHAQIAEILGCSRQTVDNYAILYKLDDQTKESIKSGNLSVTEAVNKAREVKKIQKSADDKNQKGTSRKGPAPQANEHKINTAGEEIPDNIGTGEDDGEEEEVSSLEQDLQGMEGENTPASYADNGALNEGKGEISHHVPEAGNAIKEFLSNSNPEAENKEEFQLCQRVIANADKMNVWAGHLQGGVSEDFQRLCGFIVKDMEVIREYVKKCKK